MQEQSKPSAQTVSDAVSDNTGNAEAARKMQCANNEHQILLALHNYCDTTYGCFPPLYTMDKNGKPLHSWRVQILPFLGQQELYDKIRHNEPWDSEYNKQFHHADIPVFRCPGSTNKAGDCNYAGIAGEVFAVEAENISAYEKGTANTLALVEVKKPFCWMNPAADISIEELAKGINVGRASSGHSGGINTAFLDGEVFFLPNDVSKEGLKEAGTRKGGTNPISQLRQKAAAAKRAEAVAERLVSIKNSKKILPAIKELAEFYGNSIDYLRTHNVDVDDLRKDGTIAALEQGTENITQRVKKLNKSKYENTIKLYGVIGQYRDKFNGLVNTHNNSYSTDDIESEFSKVYPLAELEW